MFGMGGTEILVILVVALLFLGPDKLPEAAKQISKGIRDLKRQSRALQQTIEDDEHIGGAIRDLKSALRGEDAPVRPPAIKSTPELPAAAATVALPAGFPDDAEVAVTAMLAGSATAEPAVPATDDGTTEAALTAAIVESAAPSTADDRPTITLPPTVGERDADEPDAATVRDDAAALAALVKPAPNTIPRGAAAPTQPTQPTQPSAESGTSEPSERTHG